MHGFGMPNRRGRLGLVTLAGIASASSVALCALVTQPGVSLAVVIRNGTVIDGTGGSRYRADVGIADGVVVRIGNLAAERATIEIDATGLYVAPGFINIHSHASPEALPTAENMLTQGVTTEIVNPDGGGFTDNTQQLADSARNGLAVNVGAYIGFNSVWSAVVGAADRRPTDEDVAKMRAMIVDGLEHGAWGVSAGLDYKPAYYAQVEEVVRVVEPAAQWRTNFPNHDRLTPESHYSSHAGVAETLAIGGKAGLVPVVTHMKSQGHEQGKAGDLLAMMDAATRRGSYTAADVYPYLAGQTGLGALTIPAWAQDGGRDAMVQRFQEPPLRARIVKETEEAMDARFGGVDGVYLPAIKRELADIAREQGVSPGEAVVRILEQRNETGIMRFGSEEDLVTIFNPETVIDRATYEEPAQLSDGIRFVIVNGVVALREGKPTGERGGRVLTRTGHMPSRPMNRPLSPRRLAARGMLPDGARVTIDLTQPTGEVRAKGTVRIVDSRGAVQVDGADLGVLQTATQWASITGVARTSAAGERRPFTLTVEHSDPFVAGHPRTVTLERQGQPPLGGVLK